MTQVNVEPQLFSYESDSLLLQGAAKNNLTPKMCFFYNDRIIMLAFYSVMQLTLPHNYVAFSTVTYRYSKWHKSKVRLRFLQLNGLGLYGSYQCSTLWNKCCSNYHELCCLMLTETIRLYHFDAVGLVFWPVKWKDNPFRKPVSEMIYTVSGGTLNPTQPTNSFWLCELE